ncbi:MAG TPA: 1-acyl-sn-glycerol-3-phosphate acyltransferase [Gemmatimonadaceae bacterium]|nr:1-acyl-sn-glycerol-3-phosphate acyltransferase [Gemmatimonadaceae bacterium]
MTSSRQSISFTPVEALPVECTVEHFSRPWFTKHLVIPLARAFSYYCRARVFGEELIPRDRPVIYVGKHPRSYLYLETALLGVFAFWDSGRPPFRVLESAHASAQRAPLLNWIRRQVGAVAATEENGLDVLRNGESLLIFPGGTRELYGAPDELRWNGRIGYARLAMIAQVPVVPFAIAGADQQHPMRLSTGKSSIWLPPIPLPVPLDFHFGAPLLPPTPPTVPSRVHDSDIVAGYAAQIRSATEQLLAAGVAGRRRR